MSEIPQGFSLLQITADNLSREDGAAVRSFMAGHGERFRVPYKRRRDDAAPITTAHVVIPVDPPSPLDEPFADALLAKAREDRNKRLIADATRLAADELAKQQLRTRELTQAERRGFERGHALRARRDWYAGIGLGVILGSSAIAIALKAGAWLAVRA